MSALRSLSATAALGAIAVSMTLAAPAAAGPPPRLGIGSHGAAVGVLQHRLVALGYLPAGSANGAFDDRTWHAVVAFQGWERLPRTGIVDGRTRTALAGAHRPVPWARTPRALELDLGRQVLLVVAHRRTVRAIHVSSARPGYATPRGSFHVYRRELMSWSAPYATWMPYALYFTGGYAVHGFDSVPAYPASHGCVRMPLVEAPYVYNATPLGTPVFVR